MRLVAYSMGLVVFAGVLAAALAFGGAELGYPWTIACLALVAVVAERASVRLSPTLEISISLLPTLFAAVLYGPLAGLVQCCWLKAPRQPSPPPRHLLRAALIAQKCKGLAAAICPEVR